MQRCFLYQSKLPLINVSHTRIETKGSHPTIPVHVNVSCWKKFVFFKIILYDVCCSILSDSQLGANAHIPICRNMFWTICHFGENPLKFVHLKSGVC